MIYRQFVNILQKICIFVIINYDKISTEWSIIHKNKLVVASQTSHKCKLTLIPRRQNDPKYSDMLIVNSKQFVMYVPYSFTS